MDQLREEHESLQRAVKLSRREFAASVESAFVKAMRQAMDEYLAMRTAGVSRDDAVKGLEAVLRETSPFKLTKFPVACPTCEDTGWEPRICWHELRCGSKACHDAHPGHEHRHVSPCGCMKGDRFRPRQYAPEDEIAAAGKVRKPKPRGFSRVGR